MRSMQKGIWRNICEKTGDEKDWHNPRSVFFRGQVSGAIFILGLFMVDYVLVHDIRANAWPWL